MKPKGQQTQAASLEQSLQPEPKNNQLTGKEARKLRGRQFMAASKERTMERNHSQEQANRTPRQPEIKVVEESKREGAAHKRNKAKI